MFSQIQELFSTLPCISQTLIIILVLLLTGYFTSALILWAIVVTALLWVCAAPVWLLGSVFGLMALFAIRPIRANVLTRAIMKTLDALKIMPEISQTEKTAIEAGSTWVEGELFSGKPNFKKIMSEPYGKLSTDEQGFIDTQCKNVCRMVNDWEVYNNRDLTPEVWEYLKKEKFFGLIIPKEYGGRGYSALAHSEVISYLTTRSIPLAITVMVPNSLGPAELILHYGTKVQKDYYLPRLAIGQEIPCFGLTEPEAGSDAGSMTSRGEVFKGEDGKLYVKLNWQKRYITLGAVSTLLGLAIKLKDPENLLGKGKSPGITCFLVPAATPGVHLQRRHDPMGVPFYNCPIDGKDVIVSVDQIIGGPAGAGDGWRMLMECLAAGRSISLPAQSTGTSKYATRIAGAYSEVRHQFGMSIGNFEGIEEVLGSMGASTYMLEASRVFTAGAVDSGIKPSVVSAIAKLRSTEESRKVMTHAMDILGGAAISRGPRNLLAHTWAAIPIGITVEGANILTRTMIIFGQGAIRCHPFAYKELTALAEKNLMKFDLAFWGHIGHVVSNACRATLLSITRGRLASVPGGPLSSYYRKLGWCSASFAILADVAMGAFGGTLKFREKVTGRFADILSGMYLATTVLRRFEAEGRRPEHEAFAKYALSKTFVEIQVAFDGLYANLDIPVVGAVFKYVVGFWSRVNSFTRGPSDRMSREIAKVLMTPGETRDAITAGAIYTPTDVGDAFANLESAFLLSCRANEVYGKIRKASKNGSLTKGKPQKLLQEALAAKIISQDELTAVNESVKKRREVIQVDSYDVDAFVKGGHSPVA
jgi:acyl-CoA dehydrogenase